MGTHPIFESDFDCLTETNQNEPSFRNKPRCPCEKRERTCSTTTRCRPSGLRGQLPSISAAMATLLKPMSTVRQCNWTSSQNLSKLKNLGSTAPGTDHVVARVQCHAGLRLQLAKWSKKMTIRMRRLKKH